MSAIRQCLLCRPLYKIFPSCKHLLSASITTSPRSFSRAACFLPPSTRASTSPAHVEQKGAETDGSSKVRVLTKKLEVLGINCDDFVTPGRYHRLFCPKCKGGQSMVRSLSLHIIQDGGFAMWRCFHTECGWAGQAFAESRASYYGVAKKVESSGQISEESIGLEPLGAKAEAVV